MPFKMRLAGRQAEIKSTGLYIPSTPVQCHGVIGRAVPVNWISFCIGFQFKRIYLFLNIAPTKNA